MENLRKVFNAELLLNNRHNKRLQSPNCGVVSVGADKSSCVFTPRGDPALKFNSKNFFTKKVYRTIRVKGKLVHFWEERRSGISLEQFSNKNKEEEKKQHRINSFENWNSRLCFGKPKKYFKEKCPIDNTEMLVVQSDKKTRKQKPILSVCGSPFCIDEDCFKQRYALGVLMFSTYFYSRLRYLTKEKDVWVHISIGDKRKSQYTKEDMKDFNKRWFAFLDAVNKKFKYRLKVILASDLAYDETKTGEETFQHIHGATRPFGLSRDKQKFAQQLKEINQLAKEHRVMFNFIGYRESKWLIHYFATRYAGKFGHKAYDDKPATDFMFADIMTKQHYYNNYLGRKKIMIFGFSRKERSWIKRNAKQILLDASNNSEAVNDERVHELVLVHKEYLFETLICPKCGGTSSIKQEITPEENKPPGQKQEFAAYEIVSFKGNSPTTIKITSQGPSPKKIIGEISGEELDHMNNMMRAEQNQKRFSRWCASQEGRPLKKSDLDFTDRLNLLATGKC